MESIIKNMLLIEGRKEDVHNKYIGKAQEGPIKDRLTTSYDVFVNGDPSGNHKYLGWMMKNMLSMILERDVEHPDYHENGVLNLVIKFHENQQRLARKDLNQYKTVKELDTALESIGLSRREERLQGAEKVFENDMLVVVTPLDQKGSCYYGSGTRWCTAARDNDVFDDYNEDGTLYYIIWKLSMPDNLSDYQKVARYIYNGHPYGTDGKYFDAADKEIVEEEVYHELFGVRYYRNAEWVDGVRRDVPENMKPFYDTWDSAKIRIDTHYAKNGMNKPKSDSHDDDDYDDDDDVYWDE